MARSYGLMLVALLFTGSVLPAATKDDPPPDKEMLQMMEILRDIDVIRQMDMMQELQSKGTNRQKPPAKKKETAK